MLVVEDLLGHRDLVRSERGEVALLGIQVEHPVELTRSRRDQELPRTVDLERAEPERVGDRDPGNLGDALGHRGAEARTRSGIADHHEVAAERLVDLATDRDLQGAGEDRDQSDERDTDHQRCGRRRGASRVSHRVLTRETPRHAAPTRERRPDGPTDGTGDDGTEHRDADEQAEHARADQLDVAAPEQPDEEQDGSEHRDRQRRWWSGARAVGTPPRSPAARPWARCARRAGPGAAPRRT